MTVSFLWEPPFERQPAKKKHKNLERWEWRNIWNDAWYFTTWISFIIYLSFILFFLFSLLSSTTGTIFPKPHLKYVCMEKRQTYVLLADRLLYFTLLTHHHQQAALNYSRMYIFYVCTIFVRARKIIECMYARNEERIHLKLYDEKKSV